jgi:hypothetical protein
MFHPRYQVYPKRREREKVKFRGGLDNQGVMINILVSFLLLLRDLRFHNGSPFFLTKFHQLYVQPYSGSTHRWVSLSFYLPLLLSLVYRSLSHPVTTPLIPPSNPPIFLKLIGFVKNSSKPHSSAKSRSLLDAKPVSATI